MHSAPSHRRSDRPTKQPAAAKASMVKRTQGRQKIQMELIRDPNALQVCFSKRRKGLVKKAFELCDAQAALVVFSPAGKPYSFAHPSFPAVADRFLSPLSAPAAAAHGGTDHARLGELQREAERLAEAVHEAKDARGKELEAQVRAGAGAWVDGDLSRCGTPQLEAALAALLGVQAEAAERAHEILAQETTMMQQQQCIVVDGAGGSHGDIFDYLGSYTAADHGTGGYGGDLFDYLGPGGPCYAPDAMAGARGHAQDQAPAMDAAIDLVCSNGAGSLFHYLGSSSSVGSFMADGGGGGNHNEVGAVDTDIRLMGGGMNHTLVPMMPLPPPSALPFSHGGFDYYNLVFSNQGAFYELDGVYGTMCNFL